MSMVYTSFLVLGLLISGVSIPLILSYQDHHDVDGQQHYFSQPLLQTAMIFIGEILCILGIQLVSKASHWLDLSLLDSTVQMNRNYNQDWPLPRPCWSWSHLWFILPSACDILSTTMLNLGLIYSTPSIFQMVRSSIVGFSALFSFFFLSRRFLGHEWISVATLFTGLGVITFYAMTHASVVSDASTDSYWFGPLLLLVSQVFVACQFIFEEHLMDRYQLDPVKAMGIEGVFGTLILGLALILATFWAPASVFDVKSGLSQLLHSYDLMQSAIVLAFMVAVFNFFGLAVSTTIGIPGRSVLDAIRTVLIWVIAAHYGYDSFSWIQLLGFLSLIIGIFLFNGVFAAIKTACRQQLSRQDANEERAPLLS